MNDGDVPQYECEMESQHEKCGNAGFLRVQHYRISEEFGMNGTLIKEYGGASNSTYEVS